MSKKPKKFERIVGEIILRRLKRNSKWYERKRLIPVLLCQPKLKAPPDSEVQYFQPDFIVCAYPRTMLKSILAQTRVEKVVVDVKSGRRLTENDAIKIEEDRKACRAQRAILYVARNTDIHLAEAYLRKHEKIEIRRVRKS